MTDFATPLYSILQLAKSLQSATSVQNATAYFITKCDSFFVTKGDKCYYKVRQLFCYKVRQVLLQSATGITKCNDFISKCERTMVTSTLGLIPRFECRKLEPALTVSRTVSLNAKEQGHGSSQVFIRVSLLSLWTLSSYIKNKVQEVT